MKQVTTNGNGKRLSRADKVGLARTTKRKSILAKLVSDRNIEVRIVAAMNPACPEDEKVRVAFKIWEMRQDRILHPSGRWDSGDRWYPALSEERQCCHGIRSPSRAFPWSLNHHCRSSRHIAQLFKTPEGRLTELVKKRVVRLRRKALEKRGLHVERVCNSEGGI